MGRFVVTRAATGESQVLPSGKVSEIELEDGDVVSVQTPGAGGWGPFSERPVSLTEKDLHEGKVTVAWVGGNSR